MTKPKRLEGVAASIGLAVGPAHVLERERREPSFERIDAAAVSAELARFEEAVARSRADIERAKWELTREHGSKHAPILDVYLLMHGDALLIDSVAEAIRKDGINAEWAVARVTERLREPLLRDTSSYFRERASDIEHVKEHLLRQLVGDGPPARSVDRPVVIVAHDLAPADAVRLLAAPTVGLITELGAAHSHTAILARTYGVPAVVGVGPLAREIEENEEVAVDGFAGEVRMGLSAKERSEIRRRRDRFVAFLASERTGLAVTRDGTEIEVMANLQLPTEVENALECDAEGVGLYRTEFMCLDRSEPPSEDEQFETYRSIVKAFAPKTVVFRTFDWRGDKRLRAHDLGGYERDWMRTQIKAILRASEEGAASLSFPMVATIEDWTGALSLVQEAREDLSATTAGSARLPLGMMVEVPSAALLADRFAQHVDFFSVGTNDLAHYTMATERGDSRSSATPLHPSVLRLLAQTVAAAEHAQIPCSLCGDVAADPMGLAAMLGLGFRRLSVPVGVMPLVRAVIRSLDLNTVRAIAEEALGCESARSVRDRFAAGLAEDLDPMWTRSPSS